MPVRNSRSITRSASAKPWSGSPFSSGMWLTTFEGVSLIGEPGIPRPSIVTVRISSWRIGAPSAIASSTSRTGGSGSYSTSISSIASSAMWGSVAQTAATACP